MIGVTANLDGALLAVTIVAALGCGLIAGAFFAFSSFVMKALARLPAAAGIAVMQSINVVVIHPAFLGVFLGAAALCAIAVVAAIVRWERPGAAWLLAGGALYLIGTFLVTMLCNVPLNNALERVASTDADAEPRWADYVKRWTAWNHVRTAAATAALASFVQALRQ
jgi:uncharacterized membrane protein